MLVSKRQDTKRNARSGASAVELAMIMPVFVMMVLGQIETSRLGMVSQMMTTAAREGCRVAVINGATLLDVQTRVNSILNPLGIYPTTFSVSCTGTTSTWDQAPSGTPITVSLSMPYSQVSLLGAPYFLTNAVISGTATLSSENP
jgi:Flp pilus assembly protein TadG